MFGFTSEQDTESNQLTAGRDYNVRILQTPATGNADKLSIAATNNDQNAHLFFFNGDVSHTDTHSPVCLTRRA